MSPFSWASFSSASACCFDSPAPRAWSVCGGFPSRGEAAPSAAASGRARPLRGFLAISCNFFYKSRQRHPANANLITKKITKQDVLRIEFRRIAVLIQNPQRACRDAARRSSAALAPAPSHRTRKPTRIFVPSSILFFRFFPCTRLEISWPHRPFPGEKFLSLSHIYARTHASRHDVKLTLGEKVVG